MDAVVLSAARRALTASSRALGWGFIGGWIAISALIAIGVPGFIVAGVVLFGVVFALPGLYILLRSWQHGQKLLKDARLVSASLKAWKVRPIRPNRVRYPLALTKYVVELTLDGGPEDREITAEVYRGIRKGTAELREGLSMDLVVEGPVKIRVAAVRWPNGRWYGTSTLGRAVAMMAGRR
jgi:hypothetical protein